MTVDCPFNRAADAYFAAGFSPFPIPPSPSNAPRKSPPPVGYTGHEGLWATKEKIAEWKKEAVKGTNIGVRLPKTMMGIDVDAYGDSGGEKTLRELEERLGELPPTWISTSRDDKVSGIRLYIVPSSLDWAGDTGPGIQIISYQYRYMVVSPSIHPLTLQEYFWVSPNKEVWRWGDLDGENGYVGPGAN